MPRTSPIFRRLCVLAGLAAAGLLAACGEEQAPRATPPAGAATDGAEPAAAQDPGTAPEAIGSPDGVEAPAAGGAKTDDEVLRRLRDRIAGGGGHTDHTFQMDVEAVAAALWDEADAAGIAAARVHVEVATVAGEVSRWLASSETAREERTKTNPTDLRIHDAFLAESAGGAAAYKAWCEGAAQALLAAHHEARRARFFPPK